MASARILPAMLLLVILAGALPSLSTAVGIQQVCRSNDTHVAWRGCPCDDDDDDDDEDKHRPDINLHRERDAPRTSSVGRRLASPDANHAPSCPCEFLVASGSAPSSSPPLCHWQTLVEAQADAYKYLRSRVMDFDVPFLETLGFDTETDIPPDGLDGGLIGPTIQHALRAKVLYSYTDALPKRIWREYVLNYANANEARSNWRPLLHSRLSHLVDPGASDDDDAGDIALNATVYALNLHMWDVLAPKGTDKIVFVGSQTPLIFDPMSVLTYGYASCTGLALLFVCALRSVGIPARLVGTPAWGGKRSSGNHNWLEVWRSGQWVFLEPTALTHPEWVDHLDQPPCRRWFCNPQSFPPSPDGNATTTTQVFAARLGRSRRDRTDGNPYTFYRMAWEWESTAVPGEDVTARYHEICGAC